MTNSVLVSRIMNGLKSLSKDDRISRRYILNVARQKASFFISQKLSDRSLYREDNLYQSLDCFKMKSIDVTRCDIIEFRNCKNIMRSVHKLPELIYSKYGNSLKEITSIDNEKDFIATTPRQYRRDKERMGKKDHVMFYVKNGYLYLLDTEVERVNLYILTMQTDKLAGISECDIDECKSLWEYEFICPTKLIEPVIQESIKEISVTKQIVADTNPNLDNNQKGKTTA